MEYPTFSEIETALGTVVDDPVYDRLNLRIVREDENDDSDGSERPVLRESGDIVESADEIAEIVADAILDEIRNWDCEDVADVLTTIRRLTPVADVSDAVRRYVEAKLDGLTSELPIADAYEERVAKVATYPVWTCDTAGRCLVGETVDGIAPIEEIEETKWAKGA